MTSRAPSSPAALEAQQASANALALNEENATSQNNGEGVEASVETSRKRRAETEPSHDDDDAAPYSKRVQTSAGSPDMSNTDNAMADNFQLVEDSLQDDEKVGVASMQDNAAPEKPEPKRRSWDQRFQELKAYRLEHGDCLVPQKYVANPKLGRWVENQRSQYHRYMKAIQAGKSDPNASGMCAERIAQLEEVEFVWTVGRGGGKRNRGNLKPSVSWNQRFNELKAYKEEHGDCQVPVKYPPNPQLGMWVASQRKQYHKFMEAKKAGTSDLASGGMNEERIAALEGIGFVWALAPGWDSNTWNVHLEELKAYKQEHGDCLVPSKYSPNPQLGKWVVNQRAQYVQYIKETQAGATNPSVGGLTEDRIAKLEEVGFSWVGRGRGQSNRARQKEKAGESEKPRAAPSRGQADDPTYKALLQDEWNQRIQELKAYKEEHGNCLVPTKWESNPKLGRWVSNQRAQYHKYMKAKQAGNVDLAARARRMNEEHIAELEELGFVWSAKGRGGEDQNAKLRWNKRLEELKAYKEEHGDCLVPSKYPSNPQLSRWVGNQRQHYRAYMEAKESGTNDTLAGAMNENRIAQLEELGFAWNTRPRSDGPLWDQRYKELVAYRNEHGDCLVPRNYPQHQVLANWIANQRTHYRLYMKAQESGDSDSSEYTFMTPTRIAQLETIGFVWSLRQHRPRKKRAVAVPAESVDAQSPPAAEANKQETWEL